MELKKWLSKAKERIDSLDAELLALKVLNEKDRSFLVAHGEIKLSFNDVDVLDKMLELRERGVPIAYILGVREFYGRNFAVSRDVLIPRPESEEIIDIAKELASKGELGEKPRILDVGTGSGCLAISMALEIANARVTGIDKSKDALMNATENALTLGARVEFFESDLLAKVKDEKFDLIVANLPYVDETWEFVSPELAWEPVEALFAGDNGMEIIYEFIEQIEKYKNTKYLILECDVSQQKRLRKYAEAHGLRHVETRGYQSVFTIIK